MFAASSSVSFLKPSILPRDFKSSSKSAANPRKNHIVAATYTANRSQPSSFGTKMASNASLYEVLGISMGASCHEIKAAYRKLARTCHPDVVAINQKENSANEFMKIHSAYSTLSDPDKRARYDREIYSYKRPCVTSVNVASSMSGYKQATVRRKWETDQCW